MPRVTAVSLLVLEPAALAGQRFEVLGEMTIGRAAGCQITLDDTFLSQLHARVLPTDDGLLIEDLGSTNGTYLNRSRVTAPVLAGLGDQVQLGGIVLQVAEPTPAMGERR
jgi:pSer/pThr/pTyr-binding forkhead associated (FHA) protein